MEMSLSARRAWIEMLPGGLYEKENRVALRKESVDRNTEIITADSKEESRSPQGERG